jgi:hypothetical protein
LPTSRAYFLFFPVMHFKHLIRELDLELLRDLLTFPGEVSHPQVQHE